MRTLYSLLAYLLAPLYCAVLLSRGLRERGYWRGWGARFGFGARLPAGGIWIHAASVGEVQAAVPLVRSLRRMDPEGAIALTTATPAGAGRAQALLAAERVSVRFVPLDLPGAVRRFFARIAPRLAIVLETELWPNLYRQCARRGVPVVLASARLSARSAARYARAGSLFREVCGSIRAIGAQSAADAERFAALGARREALHVIGNIKFDLEIPQAIQTLGEEWREREAPGRPVWVAGSTHAGEEEAALAAHALARRRSPAALLVLAPRHPPRFAEVASLLEAAGVPFVRHSQGEHCRADTEVVLLDTLGELLKFYAASDVVFVGGSLTPRGGHNLLEPAALGRAILTGPDHSTSAEVARLLLQSGGVEIVTDAMALGLRLEALLADATLRARMGEAARAVVERNRGALARLTALVEPLARRP